MGVPNHKSVQSDPSLARPAGHNPHRASQTPHWGSHHPRRRRASPPARSQNRPVARNPSAAMQLNAQRSRNAGTRSGPPRECKPPRVGNTLIARPQTPRAEICQESRPTSARSLSGVRRHTLVALAPRRIWAARVKARHRSTPTRASPLQVCSRECCPIHKCPRKGTMPTPVGTLGVLPATNPAGSSGSGSLPLKSQATNSVGARETVPNGGSRDQHLYMGVSPKECSKPQSERRCQTSGKGLSNSANIYSTRCGLSQAATARPTRLHEKTDPCLRKHIRTNKSSVYYIVSSWCLTLPLCALVVSSCVCLLVLRRTRSSQLARRGFPVSMFASLPGASVFLRAHRGFLRGPLTNLVCRLVRRLRARSPV